ncbi:MAG: hypothetical protein DRG78_00880 [Epsilonproteobacteria bacterium]|nr:MAG: hypothetical protein DRG78_00880 [Campylobacterota bacterium]
MDKYIKNIIEKIIAVAKKENKQLLQIANNDLNTELGIFHMPELAFAYECGKQIMQNPNDIFGENIPQWSRELDLGNGGPSDLVFVFNNGYKIVIEFKMRDTADAYINDLDKLSELIDTKIIKLFCAVIDVFPKDLENDGRVKKINDDKRTANLELVSFKTNQTWYKSEVHALVGIWKVK